MTTTLATVWTRSIARAVSPVLVHSAMYVPEKTSPTAVEEIKAREGLPDGTEPAIRAYVEFGRERSVYFSFMFLDALLDGINPDLEEIHRRAFGRLVTMVTSDPDLLVDGNTSSGHAVILKTWILARGLSSLLSQTRAVEQFSGPAPRLGEIDDRVELVASHKSLAMMPTKRSDERISAG